MGFLPFIHESDFMGAVICKQRNLIYTRFFDEAVRIFAEYDPRLVVQKQAMRIIFSSGATLYFPNMNNLMGCRFSAAMVILTPDIVVEDIQRVRISLRRPCGSDNREKIWFKRL